MILRKWIGKATFLALASVALAGCVSQPAVQQSTTNPFTPGNVSLTLKQGVTTEANVLSAFGSPNIVTQNSAGETVWTYQKAATITQADSKGFYATILLIGGGDNSSGLSHSQRTMTLIIYFDSKGVMTDFKSMYTSF